jgi:uncharacterized protein
MSVKTIVLSSTAGALLLAGALAFALVDRPSAAAVPSTEPAPVAAGKSPASTLLSDNPVAARIVDGARMQTANPARYDPSYMTIAYPGGDVPADRGACTDVVIRALRRAGVDLQKEVHEDMRANFALYPRQWGLSRPDTNIDHRRVPNLMAFFHRRGLDVAADALNPSSWRPGDIVVWRLSGGVLHIGVVTDRPGASGFLLVVHNLSMTAEEDRLTRWEITGHYRWR